MSVTMLADDWPVARVEHRCSLCGGVIAPGDRYRRQRYVDDDPYTLKTHGLCDAAYWVAYREFDYWDDEPVDQGEVELVMMRFFAALAGAVPGADQ